ncbi:RNAse L inhibitor, ABC superfamily [Pseudoloma neurophilia]|uniref:RNAse L inhibitor, ABC superfamily n=1 Tax=Pseudoloma neurophilia TaxID=146866 RepID=A0A0R0LZM1_9MICR|nr:RNAse L inhibitor, ABC superfamily [Pseudoloma neurophilia]
MNNSEKSKLTRAAYVDSDLCRPAKCRLECKKACPVNKMGKTCIEVTNKDKTAVIYENLCIDCGLCVKKCPFKAITIHNVPTSLTKEITHRFGMNSFKLHRLPIPKVNSVVALIGTNGIGKSTALKILSNKLKPNLGVFENTVSWQEIMKSFKGSELHGYFVKMLEGKIKCAFKDQNVDLVPEQLKKLKKKDRVLVKEFVTENDEYTNSLIEKLQIEKIMDRDLDELSGGELQRFCIFKTCLEKANSFFFDEPSSFLDIKQRIAASYVIREKKEFVFIVEHDLAIADLMSDYGSVLYGKVGCYGVITKLFSIKQCINVFLNGFVPTENMKFRNEALKFDRREKMKIGSEKEKKNGETDTSDDETEEIAPVDDLDISSMTLKNNTFFYDDLEQKYENFHLTVTPGSFANDDIIILLGENGMGKTTFLNLIKGVFCVSIKHQKINIKYTNTVQQLLMSLKLLNKIELMKDLEIERLFEQNVDKLSGGELQRLCLFICLGKDADIYLIDEPSAYLDCDTRIKLARLLKRFAINKQKPIFVVEHDLVMATYLADKIILFEGEPAVRSIASEPMDVKTAMNKFLKSLDITFRRDNESNRPRINKLGSVKDREQKQSGMYFF